MPQCPFCKIELPETDFNVAADKAYCRVCRKTFSFREATDPESLKFDLSASPPAHVSVIDRGDGVVLCYRKLSWIVVIVLPFLAAWIGMMSTVETLLWRGECFEIAAVLLIPMLPVVLVSLGVIMFLLFGRTEIREKPDGLEFFVGAFDFGKRKIIKFSEIDHAIVALDVVLINDTWKHPVVRIKIHQKGGGSVNVCHFVSEDAADYFCRFINSKR